MPGCLKHLCFGCWTEKQEQVGALPSGGRGHQGAQMAGEGPTRASPELGSERACEGVGGRADKWEKAPEKLRPASRGPFLPGQYKAPGLVFAEASSWQPG